MSPKRFREKQPSDLFKATARNYPAPDARYASWAIDSQKLTEYTIIGQ